MILKQLFFITEIVMTMIYIRKELHNQPLGDSDD